MHLTDGNCLLESQTSPHSQSQVSLSPFTQNEGHLFFYHSLTHLLIPSDSTLNTINIASIVCIQDIYLQLLESRLDLRQRASPLIEINHLQGKQPEISVKTPSTSPGCGHVGQEWFKSI